MTPTTRVTVILGLLLATLAGCGAPKLPSGPDLPGGEQKKYQCKVVSGADNPWLVEWDPTDKLRIESESQAGVLLVRYQGCELEVLYGCEVQGRYEFQSAARKRQTQYIENEDDLFAKLPVGALNLVAQFEQGDRWALDYVLTGSRRATVRDVGRQGLAGRCAGATHFVSGMAVGAYQLGAAARRKGGAEASLYGVGAGGSSGSKAGVLRQDGLYETCANEGASVDDANCRAIVQLYLQPLSEGAGAESAPSTSIRHSSQGDGGQSTPPPTSALDSLLTSEDEGPPTPAPGIGTKEYRAELEKKWAAVKKAVKGASSERQLELYQAFLTEFPVDNPYADKARKEVDRLDAVLAKELAAAAEAARKASEIEAKKARARKIKDAYDRARNTSGSASSKLAAWEAFVASYPESDNPYLSTANREIATLKEQISAAEAKAAAEAEAARQAKIAADYEAARLAAAAEAEKKTAASTSGTAGVEWVFSKPAGVQFTRSEITVNQYRACVNAGKCTKPEGKSPCNWGFSDRGNYPINCLLHQEAESICKWLGGRLPTSDEWYAEASNGGTREYPWGNQQVSCDYAVWRQGSSGCGRDSSWPVCSKRKGDSVSGLCDMSGNEWEWTGPYTVRGGCYSCDAADLRVSLRNGNNPPWRTINMAGVRCAR